MNEWFARDTSRKLKSTFKQKGNSGKHTTGQVSYGYYWDEKREHLLVDEYAAEFVRQNLPLDDRELRTLSDSVKTERAASLNPCGVHGGNAQRGRKQEQGFQRPLRLGFVHGRPYTA